MGARQLSRWEEARRGCRWNGTTWERGQGVKGQQWVSWAHPEKVTLKPPHDINIQKIEKEMLQMYFFKWFDVSPNVQIHTAGSCVFHNMGMSGTIHLDGWNATGQENIRFFLPSLPQSYRNSPVVSHWTTFLLVSLLPLLPYTHLLPAVPIPSPQQPE